MLIFFQFTITQKLKEVGKQNFQGSEVYISVERRQNHRLVNLTIFRWVNIIHSSSPPQLADRRRGGDDELKKILFHKNAQLQVFNDIYKGAYLRSCAGKLGEDCPEINLTGPNTTTSNCNKLRSTRLLSSSVIWGNCDVKTLNSS